MIGRLHVITDYHFQQKYSHAELAVLAARGGADTIQFRQKQGSSRHIFHAARSTAHALREWSDTTSIDVPLVIDDFLDIALLLNADGVHLGQNDIPVDAAKNALEDKMLVGATASTVAQAKNAELLGADYIGFGPVFQTRSKDNPASVKGIEGLRAVCREVAIPVIAIGGVIPEHTIDILLAGAHGIAVMTSITTSSDPVAATKEFHSEIEKFLREKDG